MWRVVLLICLMTLGATQVSQAEVLFCNESSKEKVFLAYAIQGKEGWKLKGWFVAWPGRCISYLAEPQGAYLYYLAHTEKKTQSWMGNQTLCAGSKSFEVIQDKLSAENCGAHGLHKAKYRQVQIGKTKQIKILLSPSQGGSIAAISYPEASEAKLNTWAAEGDKLAKQELQDRLQAQLREDFIQEDDLIEKDAAPPVDEDAFRIE